MPPKADISLLFHPKKNARKNTPASPPKTNSTSSGGSPGPKPSPAPKPAPPKVKEEDEEELKLPEGGYHEYRLMSSAMNGWKYDVFKFDSRKSMDIMKWQAPIKLNRKDLRKEDPAASGAGLAVRPMLGPDGQQVIGVDGKPVMVDVDGRPVTENASGSGTGKGKGALNGNKKKFQKKTRQVFIVPEETRNLRKEERYPWVIEDASGQETWTAQLEDISKAESYAFFMPAANDVFKFVPSHRYYKLQKKLHHDMPTDTVTMESAYVKSQKRDPSVWLHQRNGKGPSAATAAMFKAEAEGRSVSVGAGSLVYNTQQSLGPGGRKLKTVDSGADNLFGEDEEDGEGAKRRAREYGGEGDLDEITYEEDFADDEEKMEMEDTNDQEAKALEERLKKEYKNANKLREGYIDESDEEEEKPGMSKQAKAMQKIIRAREGNDAYDSEEEENPYASSQEEEEEEEPIAPTGPAVQPQSQPQSPPQSQTSEIEEIPKPSPARTSSVNGTKGPGSRAASPTPGLGGHSVVAKRATSPKAPKLKTNSVSRGGSPLASRATSPVGAGSPESRASSPVGGSQNGTQPPKKRKADEAVSPTATSPTGGGPPKAKKRKAPTSETGPGAVAIPTGPLEDRLLIEWLKNTPNASTRECIQYFTPYIKDDPEMKKKFTTLVKEVAQLKNGVLVLRSAYQGGSAAPSPAPTPSG